MDIEKSGGPFHAASDTTNKANLGFDSTNSELQVQDGTSTYTMVDKTSAQTISGVKTFSAEPVLSLDSNTGGLVKSVTVKFDVTDGHDAAVGTSTATVEIPANSRIHDIELTQAVVWNSGTSTVIDVGDDDDADGWFSQVNLQGSGELNVGQTLRAASENEAWGGANGAYLVSATAVMGQAVAAYSGNYVTAATEVIGALTTVGTVPTTGTTYMTVTYSTQTPVAATFAAT